MKLDINITQNHLNITYRHTGVQTPFHIVKITQIARVIIIKSQKFDIKIKFMDKINIMKLWRK